LFYHYRDSEVLLQTPRGYRHLHHGKHKIQSERFHLFQALSVNNNTVRHRRKISQALYCHIPMQRNCISHSLRIFPPALDKARCQYSIFPQPPCRLPLYEMTEEHTAALRKTMEEAGLV